MIDKDFSACSGNCKYYKKQFPTHIPTPTCRLFEKYAAATNVVTKSVFRNIIQRRIRCDFIEG
jgi:hypothetical protein